ncbi:MULTISPECIES: IS110 family transposase [unclassified Empedobacter]|uniref:IS110 family transposase n=1 Tax=unclassified Empedobacter TaxID=2643773 RepID=UPI0025BFA2DD|nr:MULTISPECIES: IS110 family transposase [unclassified Empedobacter]
MEKIIIGIDVSKLTLDICIQENGVNRFDNIPNTEKAIKVFFKQFDIKQEILIGMENTGRFNAILYSVLVHFSFTVYVINPLHLKKSMGLVRGKNDKIDSERIAQFLLKNYMDLQLWKPNSKVIEKIKLLNAERKHRVKIRAGLLAQTQDDQFLKPTMDKAVLRLNTKLIDILTKQINEIEDRIYQLICEDEQLYDHYKRIQSIPGVGKVLAFNMLIKTDGFTTINTPRQMACYAGVAPFDFQSGTSIKRRPKVSTMADKELKKLLHLAAMSAIRLENDLAIYYHRKVEQGKNKMAVLNAVRNKIIHRIYALIKNQTIYKNNLVLS